jgi:hypothetical protein
LKPGGTVPEMTIVELQGDLETKSEDVSLNGKFIGDLHFTKAVSFLLLFKSIWKQAADTLIPHNCGWGHLLASFQFN